MCVYNSGSVEQPNRNRSLTSVSIIWNGVFSHFLYLRTSETQNLSTEMEIDLTENGYCKTISKNTWDMHPFILFYFFLITVIYQMHCTLEKKLHPGILRAVTYIALLTWYFHIATWLEYKLSETKCWPWSLCGCTPCQFPEPQLEWDAWQLAKTTQWLSDL